MKREFDFWSTYLFIDYVQLIKPGCWQVSDKLRKELRHVSSVQLYSHVEQHLEFNFETKWKFLILNFSAEKLRLQEQLFRMRSTRKESHLRRQKLLTQAKQLQARAAKYKEKVRLISFIKKIIKLYFAHIHNLLTLSQKILSYSWWITNNCY